MALTGNRFELTFKTRLAEIVYRRPWPIGVDRLVPVPMTVSPTPPPPSRRRGRNMSQPNTISSEVSDPDCPGT